MAPNPVFLVERTDGAGAVLDHIQRGRVDAAGHVIVGLTPAARAFLKRRGVESLDTLPFFDNRAHARAARATGQLQRLFDAELRFDFSPHLAQTYRNRFSFHTLSHIRPILRRLEVLRGLRQAYPGTTLHVCDAPAAPRPLATLSRRFCRVHDIPLALVPLPGTVGGGGRRRAAKGAGVGRILGRLLTGCYLAAVKKVRRPVLVATPSMNMADLMRALETRFPEVRPVYLRYHPFSRWQEVLRAPYWLMSATLGVGVRDRLFTIPVAMMGDVLAARDGDGVREEIRNTVAAFLDHHAGSFTYQGISYADDLSGWAESSLVDRLLRCHRLAAAEASVVDRLRPALVLSPSSGQVYHVLGELCRSRRIPSVVIPFKTLAPPRSDVEAIGASQIAGDMITPVYPLAAVQTPLAGDALLHMGYPGPIVPAGPLLRAVVGDGERDRARARFLPAPNGARRLVVYAPTMKIIPPFHVVHTLDEVLTTARDLSRAVGALKDTHLILRFHPNYAAYASDFEVLLDPPAHVSLDARRRTPFSQVLAAADLVVSHGSTAAEDAIRNGIPVILYDRWARYNHLRAPEVRGPAPDDLSPAYYVPSQEQLPSTLAWVLTHHPPGTRLPPHLLDRYLFREDLREGFFDLVERILRP